MTEEIY